MKSKVYLSFSHKIFIAIFCSILLSIFFSFLTLYMESKFLSRNFVSLIQNLDEFSSLLNKESDLTKEKVNNYITLFNTVNINSISVYAFKNKKIEIVDKWEATDGKNLTTEKISKNILIEWQKQLKYKSLLLLTGKNNKLIVHGIYDNSRKLTGLTAVSIDPKNFYITFTETLELAALLSLIGLFSATRMQYRFSKPILDLRNNIKEISHGGNLSLRVNNNNKDEIGDLTNDFNAMLDKINAYQINQKKHEVEIHQLAYYDSLTKIPNRTLLKELLENMIAEADRYNKKLAVIFIDVDNFKYVNDAYGHHIGDKLLCEIVDAIKGSIRKMDMFARNSDEHENLGRLGGDEFVLILKDIKNEEYLSSIASRIISQTKKKYKIDSYNIYVSITMGGAIYPDDARTVPNLLQLSDCAMYTAKQNGKGSYLKYQTNMDKHLQEKIELQSAMLCAITNNEFVIYYQPKYNFANKSIVGVEALVRWNHPTKGLLMPNSFIEMAEETNFIIELGEWVLRQACIDCYQWNLNKDKKIIVSVNVSPKQFTNKLFIENLKKILSETKLPPNLLELEFTESFMIVASQRILGILAELKQIGVTLALDDFGTGYSSLRQIADLPIDVVKIDKSFITEKKSGKKGISIARSIIHLAHELNLSVVAEGVETESKLKELEIEKCDIAQGFKIGYPMLKSSLEQFLKDNLNDDLKD